MAERRFRAREGWVVQGFRFALDPNAEKEGLLRSHCGAARAAYNWAVSWVLASWNQRRAEETYGIGEDECTPWRSWSLPALRREFNQAKRIDPRFAEWWTVNSKEAYNTGLANAAAAFDNYAASRNGSRKGHAVSVPRLKRKYKAPLACRFTTGAIRVESDGRHVTLPVIGTLRTHEPTGKLLARITDGTARILSAAVRFDRGRWLVSFQVEARRDTHAPARPDAVAGVDLGIKHLAVVADSTGQVRREPNPRPLDAALRRLRRANRRLSRRQGPTTQDPATGKKTRRTPSTRWIIAKDELSRLHHRVANLRTDAIHKLTTRIATEYGHVVVEDLNVAGMLKNRRLARRIADAAFGEIRRQLTYKANWKGGTLHLANRWFASSKTCSDCGAVKAKLPLHVRVFDCDACPLVIISRQDLVLGT